MILSRDFIPEVLPDVTKNESKQSFTADLIIRDHLGMSFLKQYLNIVVCVKYCVCAYIYIYTYTYIYFLNEIVNSLRASTYFYSLLIEAHTHKIFVDCFKIMKGLKMVFIYYHHHHNHHTINLLKTS